MAVMAQKADGIQDSACGLSMKAAARKTHIGPDSRFGSIQISRFGKVNATKRSIKMVLPL